MESTRQHKIARLIQKDLSDIMLAYARKISGSLISVSEVRISPDLSIAHVYLSVFPQDKVNSVMQMIDDNHGAIRGEMGRLERHQLRIIPELKFHLDDTLNQMEHINELLAHN
ncbi:MAG: 30S ribosome-binding factor RbfA [Paludibacteraceae bacterium]|nr:30S ribosome-binding factor RbfA [Paludibacteraceae bacterium]